jgi:sialate O-acetylesterase
MLGPDHAFKPGFLNEAVKKTLQRFPVKGILWYQGESNAQEPERVAEYSALQQLLVQSLREYWNQPKLPFYWVQLSSIDTARYRSQLWPTFRNEQYELLHRIPHSGMAVSMDAGAQNDVHPTNKQVVGHRLALWALHHAGKEPLPSGPLPRKAVYANGKITIYFRYATSKLATADHALLTGFSLNGKDACNATINGNKVVIETAVKPERVYYGWQPFTNANLVNSAALPAPCFAIPVR